MKKETNIPGNVDESYEPITPLEDLGVYRQRMLSYSNVDELYEEEVVKPKSDLEKAIFRKSADKMKFRDTSLVAVHATDYLPQDGKIVPGGEAYEQAGRKTIHFSLNGIANANGMSNTDYWAERDYFVVAPLSELIELNRENTIGGCLADVFFGSEVKLPDTTKVFRSKKDAEAFIKETSNLRKIGKREWADVPESEEHFRESMNNLGYFGSAHENHWTKDYQDFRTGEYGGKPMSHEEALKEAIGMRVVLYGNEKFSKKHRDNLRDRFIRELIAHGDDVMDLISRKEQSHGDDVMGLISRKEQALPIGEN
jgi:hypothetical protein